MGADKKGPSDDVGGPDVSQQLVVNLVGGFGGLSRNSGAGSRCFRFMFAAIEPAYDIGTDGPRRNLRGLRLLAFAVRLFVGRADERAFDEDVRALLDIRSDTLCQEWPEHNDTMPLRFRAPFVVCVLP